MKYLSRPWTKDNDAVQYFVQRVEEMLFHYSDDIVRAPVHNPCSLIEEFTEIQASINTGRVKPYQLDPILQELQDSISHDKILRSNLGDDFVDTICNNLPIQKGAIVSYLKHKIPYPDYYKWCIEYLKEHVLHANHKAEVELGAKAWVSYVIWRGYSSEHIYSL